jgi:hypothetical protein
MRLDTGRSAASRGRLRRQVRYPGSGMDIRACAVRRARHRGRGRGRDDYSGPWRSIVVRRRCSRSAPRETCRYTGRSPSPTASPASTPGTRRKTHRRFDVVHAQDWDDGVTPQQSNAVDCVVMAKLCFRTGRGPRRSRGGLGLRIARDPALSRAGIRGGRELVLSSSGSVPWTLGRRYLLFGSDPNGICVGSFTGGSSGESKGTRPEPSQRGHVICTTGSCCGSAYLPRPLQRGHSFVSSVPVISDCVTHRRT